MKLYNPVDIDNYIILGSPKEGRDVTPFITACYIPHIVRDRTQCHLSMSKAIALADTRDVSVSESALGAPGKPAALEF